MSSFNKVLLMGNLTRDPELRVTPGGLAICKFGLAVNRYFTDKDGNRREETTFVDVDAFGKQAETISKYLTKGRPIFVEGRLRLDRWETQEGEKRSRLGVVLETFQFIGGRGDGSDPRGGDEPGYDAGYDSAPAAPSSPSPQRRESSAPVEPVSSENDDFEDDVPF